MKSIKHIFISVALLSSLFIMSSCFGDLDTMPLDDNQLVGE